MKTTTKNLSDTKVQMTIVIDAEELAIAEQVATTKLARNINVSGFRKGKVPVAIAAKNIDPTALQEETINNAISKAVAAAFTDSKIQALDRPEVGVKKFVPGEQLEFTAEVEVLPKVTLGDYKNLKVKSEKVSISDKEVNDIIDRLRHSLAEKKEVNRAAKLGDEVTIDFIGKKDDVAFDGGTGNDFPLTLGSKQFIPGFEEGVVGHKNGETFDLSVTFPDDYQAPNLKGAKAVFTVAIKAIKEVILPEVDDKLAAKAGPFKTVDELKLDIKSELTRQKEHENNEKLKDDLIQQLVSISKVPVPNILVEDQKKMIEQDFVNNLAYQGLSIEQYLKDKGFQSKEKWLETEVTDVAKKRVQSGLVLAELSKAEKVISSTDEINAQVEVLKTQYANNAEALKQFEQPEVRQNIANRLLTDKTVDRLIEINKKAK